MAERSIQRVDSAGVDPYLKELYSNFGEKGVPPRSLSQELAVQWPVDNNFLETPKAADAPPQQSGFQVSSEKRIKKSLPRQFSRSLSEELNILLQEGEQGAKDPPTSQAPLERSERTASLPTPQEAREELQTSASRSQSLPSASIETVAAPRKLDPTSGQAQLEGLLQELQGVLPAMSKPPPTSSAPAPGANGARPEESPQAAGHLRALEQQQRQAQQQLQARAMAQQPAGIAAVAVAAAAAEVGGVGAGGVGEGMREPGGARPLGSPSNSADWNTTLMAATESYSEQQPDVLGVVGANIRPAKSNDRLEPPAALETLMPLPGAQPQAPWKLSIKTRTDPAKTQGGWNPSGLEKLLGIGTGNTPTHAAGVPPTGVLQSTPPAPPETKPMDTKPSDNGASERRAQRKAVQTKKRRGEEDVEEGATENEVITTLKAQVKEYKGKVEEEKAKAAKQMRSLQMKLTYMNRQNSQQQLQIEELQAKLKLLERDNAKLTKQLANGGLTPATSMDVG